MSSGREGEGAKPFSGRVLSTMSQRPRCTPPFLPAHGSIAVVADLNQLVSAEKPSGRPSKVMLTMSRLPRMKMGDGGGAGGEGGGLGAGTESVRLSAGGEAGEARVSGCQGAGIQWGWWCRYLV